MILLAGLGNPGSEYSNTRHNIGFKVMDQIVHHFSFSGTWQSKYQGLFMDGKMPEITDKIICLKPMTYMNRSGIAISQLANFYKIPPDKTYIFHDEMNLPLPKIRVKQGGGDGGHNGLKSIDAHFGKNYWRIRMGVGHPGDAGKAKKYVLDTFKKDEQALVDVIIKESVTFLPYLLKGHPDTYMNKLSLTLNEAI